MGYHITNIESIRSKVAKAKLPKTLKLNSASKIIDVPKVIESHLAILDGKDIIKSLKPYYERLAYTMEKLNISINVENINPKKD